jgi:tyrosine-protein kinase Etk/Wzc
MAGLRLQPDAVPAESDAAAATEARPAERFNMSAIDLLLILAEHWKRLLVVPLLAGTLALGVSSLMTPMFSATARILPPQQTGLAAMLASQFGSLAGLAGAATGIKSPTDQYVSMLKGHTIYNAIIERFGLRERYGTEYIEETRQALEHRVSIVAGVKDGVISIHVEDADPKFAADMANAFVEMLAETTRRLALTEAAERRAFFEQKLDESRRALEQAESGLRGSAVDRDLLKTEPRAAIEEVARLKAATTAAEVRIASMRGFMSGANPDLRQAEQELAALRAQLARAEARGASPGASGPSEYVSRYRDFKYREVLFEMMAKQYELARLEEARDGTVIQVIDAAVPAEWKSRPKRALIAVMTTVAVFFLCFGLLLAASLLRSAGQDPSTAPKVARLRTALPFGRRRAGPSARAR